MEQAEKLINEISSAVWPIFLPFMLAFSVYIAGKTIFVIQKKTSRPASVNMKNMIGPVSVSLGAMVGTGAIVGVLGSLSNLVGQGQLHFESIAVWAVIGSIILVPLAYSETLNSKVMKKVPKDYIAMLLSKWMAVIYAVAFAALYIFGFGGFQFSGIDSVVTIVMQKYAGITLNTMQRYLMIVVPVLIIIALIVLSKKHSLFIRSMTYMIGTAVVLYFLFFIIFIGRTWDYVPVYFSRMIEGMLHPVNAMAGVPLGFILGVQRVLQTAETGLGAMAMAAVESDSDPREAGVIALVPTIITVFVSIIVTSYIASYGVMREIIIYPAEAVERLKGYVDTAIDVTGIFGLIVLCLFTVLSALTTLLGSYFFLTQLFKNKENTNIAIYLVVILVAGTLAVFGFNIIFDAVDLLLFVVIAIHVIALCVYVTKMWKHYRS